MFLSRAPHLPQASGQVDHDYPLPVPEGGVGFHVVRPQASAMRPADVCREPGLASIPRRFVDPRDGPIVRLRLDEESEEPELPMEPRRPHVEVALWPRPRLGNRICLPGFPPTPS